MGRSSTIMKTPGKARTTNIPLDILKGMNLDTGDTLVWTEDKANDSIKLSIFRLPKGDQ